MSKKKTTSERALPPAPRLPAVPAPFAPAAKPDTTKDKVIARFSVIVIFIGILTALLPLQIVKGNEVKSLSLLSVFIEISKTGYKVLGFLPALMDGTDMAFANLLPYVPLLFIFLSIIFSILALIKKSPALIYTSLFSVALGVILFFVGETIISKKFLEETTLDPIVIAIILAIIIIAAIVLCVILRKNKKKKEKKAPQMKSAPVLEAAPVVTPTQGQFEQYYEAYPYQGGPVIGIEVAEEVNPTVAAIMAKKDPDMAAQSTVASLLGSGFDPFLITLNEKEKNEFVDLYVLKCKGIMPEIPGYVVGGDNKDFFNMVFIYLGQYREKIPTGLLNKMYEFSQKI